MLNFKPFERFTLITILLLSVGNFGFGTYISHTGIANPNSTPQPPDSPSAGSASVYLPMMVHENFLPTPDPTPVPVTDYTTPIVNAPYFNGDVSFPEMAIFWFGKVTQTENYTDVRVGYNNQELVVYAAIFDRRLWYDESPSPGDLTNWDAVTLYLDTNGNSNDFVGQTAYRFDAQFTPFPDANSRANYQAAYQGNGTGWALSNTSFQTISGWRGDAWNNNQDDRGWTMEFHIPFSNLGFSGPPSDGKTWGIAMAVHDRDDSTGTPIADKTWPNDVNFNASSTWSQINFGLPVYHPPSTIQAGTATIRDKLDGAKVPDAAVGGTVDNLCNADGDFWTNWGNANFAGAPNINIQNQSDIADWPCFSKYYVSFPLSAIPAGKVIVSAKLILHQWGNTGTLDLAKPSLIQVMTVKDNWDESTLTWNNAPLAQENVSQAWVNPVNCDVSGGLGWPCVPREWDVSRAVNQAYTTGKPLQLVLYSADSDYHSGKLFTTSETGDWNAEGRPTLIVTWGNP